MIALDAETGKLLWKRPVGTHNGHDNDGLYAMRHEYSRLSLGETVYPGLLGGVIAPMATNGSTVFVPVVNHSVSFTSQTEPQESGPATGELVALDVATGAVKWDRNCPRRHTVRRRPSTTWCSRRTSKGACSHSLRAVAHRMGSKLPSGTNTGVACRWQHAACPRRARRLERSEPRARGISPRRS